MKVTRRAAIIFGATAALTAITAPPANAAYYNTYDTIASTPDTLKTGPTQGFAAGSTYLYSAKISSDESRAVIYRVNKNTGSRVLMRNGTDGRDYNTWLGHANDMTISDIDGQHHLFVVTMKSSGYQLIKLRYSGSTYYKVGAFKIHLNGAPKAVSGITRISKTSTAHHFLFKSGKSIYRGSVGLRSNSGTVNITKAFTVNVKDALVNGKKVSDIDTFLTQGFHYQAATKTLYYPVTKANRSIVLIYRNITASTSGTVTSDPKLSFRITSSAYPELFEIEGVGVSDGRLYFNTNRAKTKTSRNYDGVHAFKAYRG